VQHGQAGAAHPKALRRRGDLDWEARPARNRITVSDSRVGQAARDARSCTSFQVCRIDASGSPVNMS
jgi:hypothetical protein